MSTSTRSRLHFLGGVLRQISCLVAGAASISHTKAALNNGDYEFLPVMDDVGHVIISLCGGLFVYGIALVITRSLAIEVDVLRMRRNQGSVERRWNEYISDFPHISWRVALDEVSDQSVAKTDRAFSMPNLLAWVLPILGFIGTVWGISTAISSFGRVLQDSAESTDVNHVTGSMQTVMEGLGGAFATTLIALALSIPLIFISTICHRREEAVLDRIRSRVFATHARAAGGTGTNPDSSLIETLATTCDILAMQLKELLSRLKELVDAERSEYEQNEDKRQ